MKPIVTPSGPKGAKNEQLAQKVAYMKLKQKAKGQQSVPPTERLYFNIDVLVGDHKQVQFYFSKEWSLGRCVDYLANELKLVNKNNVKDGPKLVITNGSGGAIDLSTPLKQAVEQNLLKDGENLQLVLI